jgi:hypothetical protein
VLFAWRIAKLALPAHIEVGQLQPARFELLAQVLLGVLQHLAGQVALGGQPRLHLAARRLNAQFDDAQFRADRGAR